MKRLYGLLIILILILPVIPAIKVQAHDELEDGKYMTLKDQSGKVISWIGHRVVPGDEYLASNNRLYRVVKVKGNTAILALVNKNGLAAVTWTDVKALAYEIITFDFLQAEAKAKGPIGIYHTHTDESYIPSDGVSSKPARGGIIQVGETLTKALESEGIPVIHSKTPHDPHDAMAYDRSRRTAVQLLRDQPICLIDVHRDAGPLQGYSKYLNNQSLTKVQLVVGRQNPNFQANNDFAKKLKAVVDRKYPGLIKGIFYGKGKFNQDLGPRTILLEFGTEKNSKQAAERGAQIFAAAAREVLYATAGTGLINRGSLRSLFWIIVALAGGVGLFILLNRGSLKDIAKEFTGAVGEGKSGNEPAVRENPDENQPPDNQS